MKVQMLHGLIHRATVALSFALILLLLMPAFSTLHAQPKREVRAVWLTTLLGLDWPAKSERNNPEKQKASLRRIIKNIAEMKLNTVFFQVRSRANAFYKSSYEPWASELTGKLGKDPGWDPLAFAVEECHARGLEIHAWVNVCKVWQGSGSPPLVKPAHIVRQHPEWVEKHKDVYWIDAGIPAAREYTADVIAELVQRYDIDGIHLDYVRYPELDFSDARTYKRYGDGVPRGEWLRRNINALVKLIYDRATAQRPGLKVGAAPIGIYKSLPTARGWEGYVRLGQDSRRWLSEGYCDYVSPQIYWGLKNRGSRIDFKALVKDWRSNSSGKHIYVGTAPYRPEVLRWLFEHIDVCRNELADGLVFFRYEHIANNDAFGGRFKYKAIPPSLPWRDDVPPAAPTKFQVRSHPNLIKLHWTANASNSDVARYIVYRSDMGAVDIRKPSQILAVLPSSQTRYEDAAGTSRSGYAVTALDYMNNESMPAVPATAVPVVAAKDTLKPVAAPFFATALAQPFVFSPSLLLIAYQIPEGGAIRLVLLNDENEELFILQNEFVDAGSYIIGVERERMPDDVTVCVLESGPIRIERLLPE
jgi:uncharacterized lipoprotein YddW (UPF0748 family)